MLLRRRTAGVDARVHIKCMAAVVGVGSPHLPSTASTVAFTHSPLFLVSSGLEPGGGNPEDSGMAVYLKGAKESEGGFLEEVSLPNRWQVK